MQTTQRALTVWFGDNKLVVINEVVLRQVLQLVPGLVNHLGAKSTTQLYSAWPSIHG